jgi:colanic acid/amylovoran biosynthesis glycosyltransferase
LEEPKKPSKQFRLLFCGRFISLKGPDLALILMDQLLEAGCQNIELHLIGDGPLRNELESYVIKKGLSEIVTFHGVCTQNEVYKIMRQSDVFIYTGIVEPLTGRAETQGLVVQEAQFLELPVVSFDVGGVGLGILPEQSGFLIPSNDLTSFTKKILFLYQNKTARLEMGKRGHDWVKNEYNSSKLGQKLESIYYGC